MPRLSVTTAAKGLTHAGFLHTEDPLDPNVDVVVAAAREYGRVRYGNFSAAVFTGGKILVQPSEVYEDLKAAAGAWDEAHPEEAGIVAPETPLASDEPLRLPDGSVGPFWLTIGALAALAGIAGLLFWARKRKD